MKESTIDRQRTIIAHNQSAEVAQPSEGTLDDPAPFVAPQASTILHRWLPPAFAVRDDRFNPTATQVLAQPVAVVAPIKLIQQKLGCWSTGTDKKSRDW